MYLLHNTYSKNYSFVILKFFSMINLQFFNYNRFFILSYIFRLNFYICNTKHLK